MPIDINELRDYKGGDPAKWRTYMEQRFKDPTIIDKVLELDAEWRELTTTITKLQTDRNKLQKEVIAPKKKAKEDCEAEVAQAQAIQQEIKDKQAQEPALIEQRDALLFRIGNMVDPEVPISKDEEQDNLVVALSPVPPEAAENPKLLPCPLGILKYTLPKAQPLTHDELLWRIGGFEPTRGSNVGGHRAYFLTNNGVMLNQAIINYSIAFLSERGYNKIGRAHV